MNLMKGLAEKDEGEGEVGGTQLGSVPPAVEHRGIRHVANGEMSSPVRDYLEGKSYTCCSCNVRSSFL